MKTVSNTNVNQFINEVRQALQNHPDADDIVLELQNHIWDLANNYSTKTGAGVDEAFQYALDQMEDPKVLAQDFLAELRTGTYGNWAETKSPVPEPQLTEGQIIILSGVGTLIATILLFAISWVASIYTPGLAPFDLFDRLGFVVVVIPIIALTLYYRDRAEFERQVKRLRNRFARGDEKVPKSPAEQLKEKRKQKISAFGAHLSGFLEAVWNAGAIIFVLYISYILSLSVFNPTWYSMGIYLTIFALSLDIIRGMIRMFVGEIKASRLIDGIVDISSGIVMAMFFVFYPFNLDLWIHETFGTFFYQAVTGSYDLDLRYLLGFGAIIQVVNSIYNVFKFGTWKPKDHKSLTIVG